MVWLKVDHRAIYNEQFRQLRERCARLENAVTTQERNRLGTKKVEVPSSTKHETGRAVSDVSEQQVVQKQAVNQQPTPAHNPPTETATQQTSDQAGVENCSSETSAPAYSAVLKIPGAGNEMYPVSNHTGEEQSGGKFLTSANIVTDGKLSKEQQLVVLSVVLQHLVDAVFWCIDLRMELLIAS